VSRKAEWIDPLTDPMWEELLARHAAASIFQSRGWLQALKRTYGYEPVALATRSQAGALSSALVFCRVKSWCTGHRLVSLPFSDHCDPILESGDDMEVLVDALKQQTARQKYIELRPLATLSATDSGFAPNDHYLVHRLDLRPGADAVFRGFHKNHIVRKIQRSEREGLTYEEGSSDYLLGCFYQLMIETRRRHMLPPQPIGWFRAVLDCLPREAKIRVAFKDRRPVASMMTLSDGRTMTYKYGASDAAYHSLGTVPFLMWKTIHEACTQGCSTMDFGRSRPESTGEVAFKDNWGGTRSLLVYWRSPAPRRPVRSADTVSSARRLVSILPDRLLVAAGTALYRHIG
jgi:CelD/BcsL family acetyltransferase involved in cellulose biosynthesis